MKFAEVILPLPLYSTFTYSVPGDMENEVVQGSRVIVQFGRRKFYTGIVSHLHDITPQGYEVKPITGVLDFEPIIRYPQLKLWEWISSYYLCAPGEVFKSAVPTGLRPESETYVSLNREYEFSSSDKISERQAMVIQTLEKKSRMRLSEIEQKLHLRDVTPLISRMLREGIIEISETVVERYRPKTERMVRLICERGDSDTLHSCFDKVTRSRNQEKALICYLDLSRWMTRDPLKEVSVKQLCEVAGVTAPILKALADKGIFEFYKRTVNRFDGSDNAGSPLPVLSEVQTEAFNKIVDLFREKNVTLLHGVTGSGKTEIYARLIEQSLRAGNQVLYLVPEISLTTQLTSRMRRFFGDRMLVYHSKFSDNERVEIWQKLLRSNEPCLILGVRSSVFLPFAHLGLIIVDEEHESSYKQYDPAPRYNARDTAIMLANMHGAKTLLGSATPSIETYWKALNGKYGLVSLTRRFENATLPDVQIVDMRDQRKRKANRGIVSAPLRLATEEALSKGQQAIMFQNRRGYAPVMSCHTCGWTPKCINCDVSLVYHKHSDQLRCHYCGYAIPVPKKCPACEDPDIRSIGYGTERIAEEVHKIFEGYRVSRMDLDTTRNKDSYQEIIDEFSRHETDILIGTQMVTKGLDFERVTVVGALSADTLLNLPDFRSNERTFNMLEQVAGRAGRRSDKGLVIIQTNEPDNAVLNFVKHHDYHGYYEAEIAGREKYNYPPFCRIINIYLKNKDAHTVDEAAVLLAKTLMQTFGSRVLGPEKPFVSRVASWYMQQIMLKVEAGASMSKVKYILRQIHESLARDPRMRSTIVYYDVDPV